MDEKNDELLNHIFMSFDLLDSQRKRKIIENLTEKEKEIFNTMKKGQRVPDKYILFFC